MAVSKRLRFEILRRDNHACRYCGRTAPEVKLTIDHVVPTTLGGSDDPSNLVAACADCNGGKSSVPADAPVVDDVSRRAMWWADAMQLVAEHRAAQREADRARYDAFTNYWNGWTYNYRGEVCTVDRPDNWRFSIDQFYAAGLEHDDLTELIDVAMRARSDDCWRYFCGCCWRLIREAQEQAAKIIEAAEQLESERG